VVGDIVHSNNRGELGRERRFGRIVDFEGWDRVCVVCDLDFEARGHLVCACCRRSRLVQKWVLADELASRVHNGLEHVTEELDQLASNDRLWAGYKDLSCHVCSFAQKPQALL